ncbi:Protein of unknown function [Micromonospora lupini str. Lupac 08]|uniref:Uncharacterized protein n=1 Tax=Micromonospora lupini str. Lupac 08 TaxID=1150864 RepID=I0LDX9_9ACTN|nr:Protein of unknown function [Micromonospora lupini str. Lupac 08]
MATRQPAQRSWAPAVLVAVLALVFGGVTVAIEVGSRRSAADSHAKEAGAEADVTRAAQAYGAAVVAAGDPAPTDERLAAVAEGARVEVREVHRTPGLVVTVYGTAPFGTLFGVGSVAACHRVSFHDLGTATAGSVVERLVDCPPPVAWPSPS